MYITRPVYNYIGTCTDRVTDIAVEDRLDIESKTF